MTINQEIINGKWLEIKGEVQKAWGQLTSDEIEQTKGDMKSIAGLVQQKYGENKEQFEKKFNEITQQFIIAKDNAAEKVKNALKS